MAAMTPESGASQPVAPRAPDDTVKSVLIVRVGALGDVLHSLPAVAALRERHPAWTIGWAIEPAWRGLLASPAATSHGPGMPLVDIIHSVPSRSWKRRPLSRRTLYEVASLRRDIRAQHYDLCIDMQGSIRSSVIGRLAGSDLVGAERPRERPARWLYRQRVDLAPGHVIEQACELLGAAVNEALTAARVPLPLDDDAESWCQDVLAAMYDRTRPNPPLRGFALIAPSAGWGAKQWPAVRYGQVAQAIRAQGYATLVNASGPADEVARAVVQASDGTAMAVHSTISQLTALLRLAGVAIGGDTGPIHLAAALGIPVVALFGPTDPARNGPFGTRSIVLRDPSSLTDHTRLARPEAGLLQLRAIEVTAAALSLLSEGYPA